MGQSFQPGVETWYASDSPHTKFSAIFEDDGNTGYFYAYDRALAEAPILDAVHIYNVKNVTDRERPSVAEITWSADGLKAALLINAYPHAVIDFSERCSFCRTEFPPAPSPWKRGTWSDALMEWF